MRDRENIVRLAKALIGTPYRWGGYAPYTERGEPLGFDCSGFAIYVLRALDINLPPKGDWTAAQLAQMFRETSAPQPGDLVFYGRAKGINHVMIFLGGKDCVGATGGGPTTTSLEAARARGARVKVVRVDYRRDCAGFATPFVLASSTGEQTIGGPR